jgi:hypothetical protein
MRCLGFALSVVIAAMSGGAAADEIADAQNWPALGDGTNAISSSRFQVERDLFQTWTVVNSGLLTRIELADYYVGTDKDWNRTLTIFKGGDASGPGAQFLGSLTLPWGSGLGLYDLSAMGIGVLAGDNLSFRMSVDACTYADCNHEWVAFRRAGYADGFQFETQLGDVTPVASDLAFRTFVDTDHVPSTPALVPEPRTWALLVLGLGAVGSLLRRPQRSLRRV